MSENTRFIDMWWLVAEIGLADTMFPFYLQNGRHLGFWPLIYLVEKIWSLDWIHHAKLYLCPWFGEWVSNFVSEKRSANAIFHFHLQNCRHLGFWQLIYLVEKKTWLFDWIQHAKLHLCPRFGEYIPNFVLDIGKIRNLWKKF